MTSNIIKSFSDKAYSYDSQSFVQKDVNKRLLSRLNLIIHTKRDILEIFINLIKKSRLYFANKLNIVCLIFSIK